VISKPDQLKKKPQKAKKRTLNDILVDTLTRIEHQQNEHQKMLAKLFEKAEKAEQQTSLLSETGMMLMNGQAVSSGDDFDSAFAAFLTAYNNLKPEERPNKIRKLVRSTPTRDIDRLSELLDLFWAEGLHKEMRRETPLTLIECQLSECPHKRELERIDEFYKEFLATPMGASSLLHM
jgi:formate dehydrogenase maturation protein FdhE